MSETKSNQRFHSLNVEQVEVLHSVLSEVVPIHGRGNFPTLELRPRDIIIAVRARLQRQGISVRDVRLNGSTASHVLVRDNGTSYKDLDVIFGVELPSQEEFQVIKESVLGCLLDCLPAGVKRERISSATMKEAYVQKMVKVFNEHDRWSLISLSNNSGKNLELKFVSSLRRQFEFSVDSFQIILDPLLESYMQQELQHKSNIADLKEQHQKKDSATPPTETSTGGATSGAGGAQSRQMPLRDEESQTDLLQQTEHSNETTLLKVEEGNKEKPPAEVEKVPESRENTTETGLSDQLPGNRVSEKNPTSEKTEPPAQTELPDDTTVSTEGEKTKDIQTCEDKPPAYSSQKEPFDQGKTLNHREPCDEHKDLTEQMEPASMPETSHNTQVQSSNLAEKSLDTEQSDERDFSNCFADDQRCDDKDPNHHASAPHIITSPHAGGDTPPAEERDIETDTGELIEAERENEPESNEMTEEILLPETKIIEDVQGVECTCSFSSISFTLDDTNPNGAQETTETYGTAHSENSEKQPNILESSSAPTDTQDISPAPPSLVSDKKTTSTPLTKASERLSHMVVLKHTSPKPPRRMCRKVAPSPYPTPVSESESFVAPGIDTTPCPSPEPEIVLDPEPPAPTSDPITTTAVSIPTEKNPEPEISTNLALNLDLSSSPDVVPAPALDSLPSYLEQSSSPQITGSSCEPNNQIQKDTLPTQTAQGEQTHPTLTKTVCTPEQSKPVDTVDMESITQELVLTSEDDLSAEDEEQQTKKHNLNQLNDNPQEPTLSSLSPSHSFNPPVACLTPPMLSLSPPCLSPSPPSLSPPPCLTPPSHCLSSPLASTASQATSYGSPPLSFSPTSSCLSSPPYLTPPMLSLSPPPLCLSPPSPCLSPPLLCLTPPVESEDLVPQESSDMEPLILNTDGEEIDDASSQPQVIPLQMEDKVEQDYIPPLPQVAEPVSFPITIPGTESHALPHSQPGSPGDSNPPKPVEASNSLLENKEAPEVTTDKPEQSIAPSASDSVPDVEVLAESMYGDFEAAMDHLRYRLIATRNPEEIRGGGLLKYSNLLVRDYRPASETQIKTLERYMCSRFFIDFPDVQEQQRKILSYLKNHFIGEERSKYQYLMTLRRVVDDSTVCLMGHERRQTLNMITVLALKVLGEQNIIPNTDHVTCFYQPAPYLAEHSAPYLAEPSYCSYYIPQGGSTLLYQPYPLHLHTQTGLV